MMDAERLLGILKTKPSIVDKDDAKSLQLQTGEVKFNDVKFDYGQKTALKGVTISVPGGKIVGIVGPSGGGKSTTMKLLVRSYDPKKGSIQIDGQDIRDVTLKRYVILKTLYLVWRLRVTVFISI
jgi:ABC-type multidrug transport system fused ATPase/permease subunit